MTPPSPRVRACILVAGAFVVVGASACASAHAVLPAPPAADAPVDERRAYFAAHRAAYVEPAVPGGARDAADPALVLASGARVEAPSELVDVVEDPAFASAARDVEGARALSTGFAIATYAGLGLGVAVSTSALAIDLFRGPIVEAGARDADLAALSPALHLATGVTAIAVAPVAIGWIFAQNGARELEERTLLSYDDALRTRLALNDGGDDVSAAERDDGGVPAAARPVAVQPPGADVAHGIVLLEDGARVAGVGELLARVDDDSAAARSARDAQAETATARGYAAAGGATLATGMLVGGLGLTAAYAAWGEDAIVPAPIGVVGAGLGALGVAAAVAGAAALVLANDADDDARAAEQAAWIAYDEDIVRTAEAAP